MAAVVVAVLGSLMVSYTRARAEALGVACKVGLATRPVRVVILSIGLVFAKGASIGNFELLAPAVYVLAALIDLHDGPAHPVRPQAAQRGGRELSRSRTSTGASGTRSARSRVTKRARWNT